MDAVADIDDSAGAGGDDPDHQQVSQQLVAGVAARLGGAEDRWGRRIGLSIVRHHREDNDVEVVPVHDTFDSETLKLDWQNNVKLSGANSLAFGVEAEREGGRSGGLDEAAETAGLYVQDEARFGEGSSVAFGARVDDHSMFGTEATWRVAAAHLVAPSGTKLKATVGTAFKAPTLYQLYSSYGDPGLLPEESLGWDVGVEGRLAGGAASAGVTYFRNDFENLIEYDFGPSKYANIGKARTQGAEVVAAFKARPALELSTSYTYTEAVDETTGAALIRRPDHKVGFKASWRPSERATVDLRVTYVGERADTDPVSWLPVTLEPYALVGIAASFEVSERLRVFARIENLLDQDYEEAAGYGAPGASAFLGVKARF